jgi:hypothetical protein
MVRSSQKILPIKFPHWDHTVYLSHPILSNARLINLTKFLMPRPKLYKTAAEKRDANRAKSKRSYLKFQLFTRYILYI